MRYLRIGAVMLLTAMMCLGTVDAQLSKEEQKMWKQKAKEYKRNPEKLKMEFDQMRNQISQRDQRIQELEQQNTMNMAASQMVIDSMRQELMLTRGDLEMLLAQEQGSRGGGMNLDQGLVYRVQIGAYEQFKMQNPPTRSANFSEVQVDGMNKYLLGAYATNAEAEVFRNELRQMGIQDAWVVPFIDGQRVTHKQAEAYQFNQ